MKITLLIQILTLLVLFAGGIIAWIQLKLLRKQIKAQHDWNRRVSSLQYSFSSDPQIREVRSKLDKHLGIHVNKTREINLEEIEKLSKETYPHIMTDIQFILGRIESMCVAIKNGIVDEQTCKDMLRGIVIQYYRFFRQYIEKTREIRTNPKIYIYLQHYAQKWENNSLELRKKTDAKI